MRYRIEYLTATPVEASVCIVTRFDSSLAAAVLEARAGATVAMTQHRADGFQIRDDFRGGGVVTWERFSR